MNYYRKLLALFAVIWFLVGIERFSIAYLLPEIAREFGMSQTRVGAVVAIFAITWGLGVFTIGNLTDRLGGKRVAVVGSTLFAALFGWITGLAGSFLQLLAIRGIMGFGEGGTWAPVSSSLSEESPDSRRGSSIGLIMSTFILGGTVVAPVVATGLAAAFSWRVAFFVIAVPGALVAIVAWFVMREPPSTANIDASSQEDLMSAFDMLTERNILVSIVAVILFLGWIWVVTTFEPFYLETVHGIAGERMGMIMTAFGLGATIGAVGIGAATDLHSNRRDVIVVSALLGGLVGIGHAYLPPGSPTWLIYATLFLFAFFTGFVPALMVVIPAETVGFRRAATAIGFTNGVGEILGGGIFPIIGGSISDVWGPRSAIVFGGILLLAVGGVAVFLEKVKPGLPDDTVGAEPTTATPPPD